MSTNNPLDQQWQTIQAKVHEALKENFPQEGRKNKLVLHDVHFDESKHSHLDIKSQEDAKLNGRTWGVPVYGQIGLVDKATGKEIDRHKVRLMTLPKPTQRYSFIVDGNEKQVDNLWKLRSGVYAAVRQNGEHMAEFNLATPFARNARLYLPFDPESRKFKLSYGDSNIPLYSVLKIMGVDDSQMKKSWGDEIYQANALQEKKHVQSIESLYKKIESKGYKAVSDKLDDKAAAIHKAFTDAKLLPETTKAVFGKPIDHVSGEALLLASHRILSVSRGDLPPDDRDSLVFKDLHSVDDFLKDKLTKWKTKQSITRKINNNLDRQVKVRDIVGGDIFNKPLKEFFSKDTLSRNSEQVNPLDMLSNHRSTTIFAPESGGIKDTHMVTDSMKLINPSHMGFLDPIHTPESERTGVTLHLPVGVKKVGNEARALVYDLHKKKLVHVGPAELHTQSIVLPDQVSWKNKIPKAIGKTVKMKDPVSHEIVEQPMTKGRYLMLSAHQLFDESTNLVPFLQNNQGNRTMVASKQLSQAVSLHHREAPKVQVRSGNQTWEKIVGTPWSHESPVDGHVVKLNHNKENGHVDSITTKGVDGKIRETQLYNHFPLNDAKSFLHASVNVKAGDKITKGQVLADSNYTKNGDLALGTNLRVSYLPYKGYNFEDGIVISDSASKKLTSEHVHRHTIDIDPEKDHLDKKKFITFASTSAKRLTKEQADKLDDHGFIRVGSKVTTGDTLIAAVGKRDMVGEAARAIGRLDKKMFAYHDKSVPWDSSHAGEVVKVVKSPNGRSATVYVKTLEPAEIGDKMVGRHGNKGIITSILPDNEMPRIGHKDGDHVQVLMNPTGVPSRINIGQVLETAAGKISEKTGKPYIVQNFGASGTDYTQKIKDDLKHHGLKDTDTLYDAQTGNKLGDVLTGHQYILKLKHQVEKKLSVRGGGAQSYTLDMAPRGTGAANPGQAIGQLEFYALLAHGARANLREMATYKGGKQSNHPRDDKSHIDFWHRVANGQPLPAPQAPFAYKKFEALLTGLGVDIKKEGHELVLQPLTDKGVLALSNGLIKDPGRVLRGKDAKELEHGLFDVKITGGLPNDVGKGTKWSHITLAEPVPNPVFVGTKTKPGPAVVLTGLKFSEFEEIARGAKTVDGLTGGKAIEAMLKKVDTKAELKKLKEHLPNLRGTNLDKANRKVKYLQALEQTGFKAHEAYVMNHVPVLPPMFRPVTPMPNGALRFDDINHHYKSLGHISHQLKTAPKELGHEANQDLRGQLYDVVKSLAGIPGGAPVYDSNRKMKGILDTISGDVPKDGYFQKRLMKRRQDLSMRSTIIPEPAMHLDQVGLPKDAAMELYKPFVNRELQSLGYSHLQALGEIKKNSPLAHKALDKAMEKRPILLKRDPALHKYSIMAFRPKVVEGKAIKIHPLVTAGYNADFDGDTMSAFVPLTDEAVTESHKMFPSNNLFSATRGTIMYAPEQESLLGLNLMTKWGKQTTRKFSTFAEALKHQDKGLHVTDVITVGKEKTTLGRLMVAQHLPDSMKRKVLTDPKMSLVKHSDEGKGSNIGVHTLLDGIARSDPQNYASTVDSLKNLGNKYSYEMGFSIGLKDLHVDKKLRDGILAKHEVTANKIRNNKKLTPNQRHEGVIDVYTKATEDLIKAHEPGLTKSNNNFYKMVSSGARGKMSQFRQMVIAPMLMKDGAGNTLITPVKKSYSEGLDIGDYWTTMHGARMGTLQKVEGTSEPGRMTKEIVNVVLPHSIVSRDCGTSSGVSMSVKEKDIHDRFLASSIKLPGGQHLTPGTLLTPEITATLKRHKVNNVIVRSPLKCTHGYGMCAKCYGLSENGVPHEVGVNIGVIAGQSLGEPATQLAMDSFHCNHADSLVYARQKGQAPLAISMEALFDLIESPIDVQGDEEVKKVEGWEIYDGEKAGMVTLTHVRRHAPDRPMVLVGDGGLATICQDNHPIAVWQNEVRCERCGNHRLKKPSKASRALKYYCSKCSLYQDKPETSIGKGGFLSPVEMEVNRLFLHRDLLPSTFFNGEEIAPPELPPYFVGMFLAEGCVLHRYAQANIGEKKPYTVTITQNDGPIKDQIVENLPAEYRATVNKKAIVIHSLELGTKITSLFGRYSRNKALPALFMQYPKEWVTDVLSGIIDGDGTIKRTVDGPDQICIDTTSFELAQQVLLICARLGITSGLVATKVTKLTRHQGYRVSLRMTKRAVDLFRLSYKAQQIEKLSPEQEPELRGYRLLRKVRPVLYTHDYVYDATTSTGTLYVSGLKSHNTGGVAASRGGGAVDKFTRLNHLLSMPKNLPNSAVLSKTTGKVQKVEKDKATNGWNVTIGGEKHFIPAKRTPEFGGKPLKVGSSIKKGDRVSDGYTDPHDLLKYTDIHRVQNHLVNELHHGIYKSEGVKRRNIETVVRSLTNLSKVTDPGHSDYIHGDTILRSVAEEHNRGLTKGQAPLKTTPLLRGAQQMAREQHEDWMARLNFQQLRNTVLEGASKRWRSNIHSSNPVPAYAHGATFGKGDPKKPGSY